MKTHVEKTAAVDWSRARALLSDLKSAVRLSLALQILLGMLLAPIKKRLFPHGGDRKGSSRQIGDLKTWDQHCREEMGIAARSADRYIQCFESAKARATNLKAKAIREKAKALDAGEAKDSEKWEKVIKKCDRAIGLLQTPVEDLTGGEEKELMAHVGFLIQRQDPETNPTAAANITQGELLEELGIKAPSNPLKGGKNPASGKSDQQKTLEQMADDMFWGIRRRFGDLQKEIFAEHHRTLFLSLLVPREDGPEAKDTLLLRKIRDSLREVHDEHEALEGELQKMIKAVESTIRKNEQPATPAKPRRVKNTKA